MLNDLVQFLDENILVTQILTVLVYALLAKIADLFIDKVLKKLADKTHFTYDDTFLSYIHTPFCWTIFIFGIQHALILKPMSPPWQFSLPALASSIMLIIWWIFLIRLVNLLLEKKQKTILSHGKIGTDLFNLLKNLLRVVLVIMGLLWFLAIWEIDLTPLFASAGIAGIAVALAAKDTLANFFGGISIFMDKTYKVGDYIIIDSGERGEVVEIGIRSTRVKTRDDVLITIPNALMANSKIINESAPQPRFRIRVPVGVAYGSDLEQVEKLMLEVAKANPNVVREPEPRVRVRSFGNSSIDFELLLWVHDPRDRGLEIHNLLKHIYTIFDEQDITIPFPQMDVHLDKVET